MSEIIQLITAVTAFVAVIVSPILTIYVARKQIRASVVSTNRQAWINTVRGTLADYLAKQAMVRNLNKNCYADDESLPRIEETVRLTSRIELLMNPKEPDHSKLVELVCEMTNALNAQAESNKGFDDDGHRDKIVEVAQTILKREWDRVKRGD